MKRHTTRAWLAVTLLSLTLAGCASGATSKANSPTAAPAPTATPAATVAPLIEPPVYQLALSGVKVGTVLSGVVGAVLSPVLFSSGLPATGANLLVRTPDGVFAALGGSGALTTIVKAPVAIYQGRAYIVTSSGGVEYIDLPAE